MFKCTHLLDQQSSPMPTFSALLLQWFYFFFLKMCSNLPYKRIRISCLSRFKYADLFLLAVAMVNHGIRAPLMWGFYSLGVRV